MYQLASRIAAVVAIAGSVTAAHAQGLRHGGGGGGPAPAPAPHVAAPAAPHIAAPAPHFAAPAPHVAAPAPHFAAPAPHFAAPAHAAAPHFAAPAQHAMPHVNAPHIARGHGPIPGGTTGQAVRHQAIPHVATAPQHGRGAERRLSHAPTATPNLQTQGRGNAGNLARQHTPPTGTARTNTPSTVGVGGAGGRDERGLSGLTREQRSVVDRWRQQGARLNTKGAPVLRNPALASLSSRRDPAARALANATFKGNFAERFHTFDRHGDRDRDRDRRFRHFGFVLGWVGPVFWPYAYEDFVDYTFYPVAYDVFWPYAYDDVYDSILGEFAYGYGGETTAVGGRRMRSRLRVAQAGGAGGGGAPQVCAEQAPQLIDLPIQRIERTVQPDDNQRADLNDLKDAIAKAVKLLQSNCPTDVPTTPVGRLDAMHHRLDVMLQAVQTVRPALEKFYDDLNDEQKARFNAIAVGQQERAQPRRDLTQLCSERATGAGGLPIDRIEKVLRLNDDQRAKLEDLQKASLQAADQLKADCPTDQPVTPVARLQAMEQRLNAMLKAIDTVQPALTAFYNSLTDEQKTRFNTMSLQQA